MDNKPTATQVKIAIEGAALGITEEQFWHLFNALLARRKVAAALIAKKDFDMQSEEEQNIVAGMFLHHNEIIKKILHIV